MSIAAGRSQAVRLPKACWFAGAEVVAKRFGNGALLLPIAAPWAAMREVLDEFEPGLVIDREPPPAQERGDWTPP